MTTHHAATKTIYATIVIKANSWNEDGTPIIERDCGHRHRTMTGAERCHRELTRQQRDGWWRADFWRAEVRHHDGSRLTAGEAETLFSILRAQEAS